MSHIAKKGQQNQTQLQPSGEQQDQKQLQPSEEQRKAEHKLTKRQQNLADPNYPNQRTIQQSKKEEEAKKSDTRDEEKESLRSRSQSRRNWRKRIREGMEGVKQMMKINSVEALEEADATGDLNQIARVWTGSSLMQEL